MSSPYYEWTYDDLVSAIKYKQQAADNVLGAGAVDVVPEWCGYEYMVSVWVAAENKSYQVDPSPDCDPVIDFLLSKFPNADWELEGYEVVR